MQEIEFQKLSFPRGLNLGLLQGFLSEQELRRIIIENCRKTRVERRIILPSKKCLKKILCHYLVEKYQGDYNKVMADMKDGFKTLKQLGIDRKQVRQLHKQREGEIKKGR